MTINKIDLSKRTTGLACYFRFVGTDYIGIAVSPTVHDLFWNIDQYGDPYSVELAVIREGSVCFLRTKTGTEENEDEDEIITEVEYDEGMDEESFSRRSMKTQWGTPIWPEYSSLVRRLG